MTTCLPNPNSGLIRRGLIRLAVISRGRPGGMVRVTRTYQVLETVGVQFLQGVRAVLGAIFRHQGRGVGHHESQSGVIHALEAIKRRFQVVIDQDETVLLGESRQSRREGNDTVCRHGYPA